MSYIIISLRSYRKTLTTFAIMILTFHEIKIQMFRTSL